MLGDLGDMTQNTLFGIQCAFTFATRIRVRNKTAVPPISANIVEKMMNDAIAKRCSDDFTNNWIAHDEGDAASGAIMTSGGGMTEVNNVSHSIEFETVFVNRMAFALASVIIG